MNGQRLLIVNADDFGQTAGINRGIIEAHERGIVTSTSLMVRGAAVAEAAAYAFGNPRLAVGLHFDLGEWTCQDGQWRQRYVVVPVDDAAAIRAELCQQLDAFRQLLGRDPAHIDSHQHVHREEPTRSIMQERAAALQVPLRHLSVHVCYCGRFYGQTKNASSLPEAISSESLSAILRGLPTGITELACHPGYADDLDSDYRVERTWEIAALCDPDVRETLAAEQIQLISFVSEEIRRCFRTL